jgi:poly-gamma-glutamate synthesis protein (capsule biosynthesis protein)
VPIDPDYPRLPYGIDSKRSLIAKAKFTARGIQEVSFVPVLIDKDLRPLALVRADNRFDDAVEFMEWVSEDFNHCFKINGNEVSVSAT